MRSAQMDTGSLPIMTYEGPVITGGSHAPTAFYSYRPAGPPLRRSDPSGPLGTSRPRTQVPGRPTADPVALRRRADHLALRRLPVPARRPLRRGGPLGLDRHLARLRRVAAPAQRRTGWELAPGRAPAAATPGRRPGLDPLSRPTAARPRGDLPLCGQERHQSLPRLRDVVGHPPGLPLHRGLDGGLPRRAPGGGPQAPAAPGRCPRHPLPLAALGPGILQRGGDPVSPGGAPSLPDAGDLPRPQARRSAGPQRDQRLLDLGAQRLWHLHPARCPEAAGPGRDLRQMPLLPRSMAPARQAATDLRLLGVGALVLRLDPADVSPAVRHRDDLPAVASGADSDHDPRSPAAAVVRGDRADLAERLGVVAPCGGAEARRPGLGPDPTVLMTEDCGSRSLHLKLGITEASFCRAVASPSIS